MGLNLFWKYSSYASLDIWCSVGTTKKGKILNVHGHIFHMSVDLKWWFSAIFGIRMGAMITEGAAQNTIKLLLDVLDQR